MITENAVDYYYDIVDKDKMKSLTKSKSVQHIPRVKMNKQKIE